MPDISEFENLETWKKPENKTFGDWIDSRIARFETRTYDWDALKFQADYDPKYARAQCLQRNFPGQSEEKNQAEHKRQGRLDQGLAAIG